MRRLGVGEDEVGQTYNNIALRFDPLGGDVHLQRIRLCILWVPKVEDLFHTYKYHSLPLPP